MKRIKLIDNKDILFNKCWELYNLAFPEIERRPLDYQLEAIKMEAFNFEAILDDNSSLLDDNLINNNHICNSFIGFISWWEFDDLIYIEHFAVDNSLRGGGFGKKILNNFMQEQTKPILLEVEHPHNSIQRRRINFYEREGFILNHYSYKQPPYNGQDGEFLELLTMTYPTAISQNELNNFVATKLPLIHFRYFTPH